MPRDDDANARIIRRLREENDELRERVRQLEEAAATKDEFPADWPISPTMRAYLLMLASGRTLRRSDMIAGALDARGAITGGASSNVVSVHLYRSREFLASIGVTVRNRRGIGYYLDDVSLANLRVHLRRGGAR